MEKFTSQLQNKEESMKHYEWNRVIEKKLSAEDVLIYRTKNNMEKEYQRWKNNMKDKLPHQMRKKV